MKMPGGQLILTLLLLSVLWCVLVTPGLAQAPLPGYGESDLQPSYSEEAAAASAPMSGIDMLRMSVPGNPGQVRDREGDRM